MIMAKASAKYDEDDIAVYLGLEGIRKKPSMYLGDMSEAAWTCVREVADNCQDEFLAGRNDSCLIVYDGDYVWIADKGAGIPVDVKTLRDADGKPFKESTLTSVVSRIHAGGKFTDSAYKVSAGTHGVGIKAVNAVSEEFDVWTCRSKVWHHTAYKKGKEVSGVSKAKAPRIEKAKYTPKTGTVVRFKLDKTCFPKGTSFNSEDAHKWASFTRYLNAGFKIVVIDDNGTATYQHPDGLWGLIEAKYDAVKQGDMSYEETTGTGQNNLEIELLGGAHMWCDYAFIMASNVEGVHLDLYTNGVSNPDGGVHQDAFWAALMKALEDHAPRSSKFVLNDIKEGLVGVVNVKINAPAFNNQTKEKLVDQRVRKPLYDALYNDLYEFFRTNKAFVKEFCAQATELNALRNRATMERRALMNIKKTISSTKPSKFAGFVGSAPKESLEIFLVEGDSAGGSAKRARFKNFQAVLPLKGKPLNAIRKSDAQVLASEEIVNIFNCIGYVPDGKSTPNGFGRLILLSDSDVDGYHINALILAMIQKYMPELFDLGKVFAVDTRNVRLVGRSKTGKYYFGATAESVMQKAKAAGETIVGKASYLKGWGELDPEGLRDAAMNPETRRLIRLTGLNKRQAQYFNDLMGESVEYRKKLLGITIDEAKAE